VAGLWPSTSISVNLSVRNLIDDRCLQTIGRLLSSTDRARR
jgi:hypothetical protein